MKYCEFGDCDRRRTMLMVSSSRMITYRFLMFKDQVIL